MGLLCEVQALTGNDRDYFWNLRFRFARFIRFPKMGFTDVKTSYTSSEGAGLASDGDPCCIYFRFFFPGEYVRRIDSLLSVELSRKVLFYRSA